MDAFYEKKKDRLNKFFMKDRQPFGAAGIRETGATLPETGSGRSASLPLTQTIWSERFMIACRR